MKRRIFAAIALLAAGAAFARQEAGPGGAAFGGMARVEGGTFLMGSCPTGRNVEPARSVTVSAFYMGRLPVTQREWAELMGWNPSRFRFRGGSRPVERVSWLDAIGFANAKSLRAGLEPVYAISGHPRRGPATVTVTWDRAANGYRLPTEAEWEFAARGGIACQGNFAFSGGDSADEVAWHSGNSRRGTRDVGAKRPNALGIYDMSGNVWEWVWDWYGPYPSEAQADPAGAPSGYSRAMRGGSWNNASTLARSVARSRRTPFHRWDALGLRLARSP